MNNNLTYDFKKHTNADWLDAIGKELKKELTSFPEFEWEPGCVMPVHGTSEYIHRGAPAQFPYGAGWNRNENHWEINQAFTLSHTHTHIENALANDVSSITLNGTVSELQLNALYKDVLPQFIETHFLNNKGAGAFMHTWKEWLQKKNIPVQDVRSFMGMDPLSHGHAHELDRIHAFATGCRSALPASIPMAVNGVYYENEGATIAQRLAFTLAHAHEYVNTLVNGGMSPDEASACIAVYFPVSVSFLHEIAALRAFRMLWANVMKAYNPQHNCTYHIYIQAVVSDSYWSVYDEYNNLIRATVQSMAAVSGGCNSLCITPFNSPAGISDEFSLRLSRNIQHILKNESYLNAVTDPAAGSFYVEELTEKLCNDAWNIFLEIEKTGGLNAFIQTGKLKDALHASSRKRKEALASGARPVIGLNKYQNKKETETREGTHRLVSDIEKTFHAEGGKVK